MEAMQLETVLGVSVPSAHCTAWHPSSPGVLAYAAGAVVVLYDVSRRRQLRHLRSPSSSKVINCLTFSPDGNFVVGGERGNSPAALVWDLRSGACVKELVGHFHGVGSLAFSPDGACLGL